MKTIVSKRAVAMLLGVVMALRAFAFPPLEDVLKSAQPVDGLDLYNYQSTLSDAPLSAIEGVWRATDDGGLFAVVRHDKEPDVMLLVVVDAADHRVAPGTVMGAAAPLAAANSYDARIFSHVDKQGRLSKPKRFTLRLEGDDSRLIMQPADNKWSLNPLRLIPYMSRISIRKTNSRQVNLDGALRVFPSTEAHSEGPVWL